MVDAQGQWAGDPNVPQEFRAHVIEFHEVWNEFAADKCAFVDQNAIDEFIGSLASILRNAHADETTFAFRRWLETPLGVSALNASFGMWRCREAS